MTVELTPQMAHALVTFKGLARMMNLDWPYRSPEQIQGDIAALVEYTERLELPIEAYTMAISHLRD